MALFVAKDMRTLAPGADIYGMGNVITSCSILYDVITYPCGRDIFVCAQPMRDDATM